MKYVKTVLLLLCCIFVIQLTCKAQKLEPTADSILLVLNLKNGENIPYANFMLLISEKENNNFCIVETDSLGAHSMLIGKNKQYNFNVMDGNESIHEFYIEPLSTTGKVVFKYEEVFDYFNEDKTGEVFITDQFSQTDQLQATDSLVLIKVLLTNPDSLPLNSHTIIFKNFQSKQVFIGQTNNEGKFQLLLPKNAEYGVRMIDQGCRIKANTISTFVGEGKFSLHYNMVLKVEESQSFYKEYITRTRKINKALAENNLPNQFILEHINFDFDKATLRPNSKIELNQLSQRLKQQPTMMIEIEGHTDNEGDRAYNQKLSEERARSVVNYLIETGISPTRLKSIGYGESKPIATNESPEGRQQNRRTVVNVLIY